MLICSSLKDQVAGGFAPGGSVAPLEHWPDVQHKVIDARDCCEFEAPQQHTLVPAQDTCSSNPDGSSLNMPQFTYVFLVQEECKTVCIIARGPSSPGVGLWIYPCWIQQGSHQSIQIFLNTPTLTGINLPPPVGVINKLNGFLSYSIKTRTNWNLRNIKIYTLGQSLPNPVTCLR